jgi:predicted RNA binding protein YcfA (HicA-like mRNA interferase family)
MTKFPVDAPINRVIKTLEELGFRLVREGNHISMIRDNPDGTHTPLTIPNHKTLKSSTLRTVLTQSGIRRDDFLDAYKGLQKRDKKGDVEEKPED